MTVVVSAEHDAEIRRVSLDQPRLPRAARSSSPRTPRSSSPRRPPTSPTRPSRTSSCRPSSRPRSAPSWRPGGCARPTSNRSGRPTSRRSRAVSGGVIQYETDRARFLGRGRSIRSPVSVIDGRPLSNTVGAGAGPDLQPPLPRLAGPRRDRPRDLLDRRRGIPGRGPGPRRQVPGIGDLRAGGDPRLDAGPGPAPPPRHRGRRGAPLPAPGQPDPLLGPDASTVARPAGPQPARRARACGRTASPATCRSSSSGSTRPRTSTSSASCSGPTSTGG